MPQHSYSLGSWRTYTPTWTSTGTQPVLGNGVLDGLYAIDVGGILAVQIHLSMGSTTTFGTSDYRLSIPTGFILYSIHPGGSVGWQPGAVSAVDTGTAYRMAIAAFLTGTNFCQIVQGSGATGYWTNINPHTWASGDEISISGLVRIVE